MVRRAGSRRPGSVGGRRAASGLHVGERVVVEFREAEGAPTAVKVRVGAAAAKARFSCPMHPDVISDKAGKCPKCGMTLTQREGGQ